MFCEATSFDQNLITWNVSNLEDMSFQFKAAESFNHPLGTWDVSRVRSMVATFDFATTFDQDLSTWDVSNVVDMSDLFRLAESFNHPLNDWDISQVKSMYVMFYHITFDQDLSLVTCCNPLPWSFAASPSFGHYLLWAPPPLGTASLGQCLLLVMALFLI